jgi:hypothetical protein
VDDWPQFCSEICDVPNDRVEEHFLTAIPIFWRRGMARGAPSPTGSEKPTSAVDNRSRKGSFRAPHISLENVGDWPQFCSEICDAPNDRVQEQFLTAIPIFWRRGMARGAPSPTGSEKPTSAVQNRSREGSFRAPHISLEKWTIGHSFAPESAMPRMVAIKSSF